MTCNENDTWTGNNTCLSVLSTYLAMYVKGLNKNITDEQLRCVQSKFTSKYEPKDLDGTYSQDVFKKFKDIPEFINLCIWL